MSARKKELLVVFWNANCAHARGWATRRCPLGRSMVSLPPLGWSSPHHDVFPVRETGELMRTRETLGSAHRHESVLKPAAPFAKEFDSPTHTRVAGVSAGKRAAAISFCTRRKSSTYRRLASAPTGRRVPRTTLLHIVLASSQDMGARLVKTRKQMVVSSVELNQPGGQKVKSPN